MWVKFLLLITTMRLPNSTDNGEMYDLPEGVCECGEIRLEAPPSVVVYA